MHRSPSLKFTFKRNESPTSCILRSKRRGQGKEAVEAGSMEFKIKKGGGEGEKEKRKERRAANIGNGRKLRATGKEIKAFACALCTTGFGEPRARHWLVIFLEGRSVYEVGLREGKTTWGGGGLVDFVGAYRRYRRRDDRTWSLPGREPTPLPRTW